MAFSTAALVVSAVASVASTGYNIYSGERAAAAQKRALQGQKAAQEDAKSAALAQERQAQENINRANRKQPDLGAILGGEQKAAATGVGSTLLTGPGGVDPNRLLLGKKSLLGG